MAAAARSALFAAVQALITFAFSLTAPFLMLLPRLARWHIMARWNRSIIAALRVCCGLDHEVIGRERLPPPPYVIISKHQSAWETIAFACIFPPTAFVAKRELLWIPCFGWGLATMSPITINRSATRAALRAVLAGGSTRLGQGFCVCIFPEGTRIEPGRTAKFAASGIQLAATAGVPAVPVALNSGRFWRRSSWIRLPGRIAVSIGEPTQPQMQTVRQDCASMHDWIAAETERLGG